MTEITILNAEDGFARIPKFLGRDRSLGDRAVALVLYILCRKTPKCDMQDICRRFGWGRHLFKKTMRNLEAAGYAKLKSIAGKDGTWLGRKWEINLKTDVLTPKVQSSDDRKNWMIRGLDFGYSSYNEYIPAKKRGVDKQNKKKAQVDLAVEDIAIKWSHKLENFLRRKRRLDPKHSPKRWYREFRLLLKDIGNKDKITRTLKFYIDHSSSSEFAPRVFGAKDFRHKFHRIEDWVRRSRERSGDTTPEEQNEMYAAEIAEMEDFQRRLDETRRKSVRRKVA